MTDSLRARPAQLEQLLETLVNGSAGAIGLFPFDLKGTRHEGEMLRERVSCLSLGNWIAPMFPPLILR